MRTRTVAAIAALLSIMSTAPVLSQEQGAAGQPGGQQGGVPGATGQPINGPGDANFDPKQPIRPHMVISVSVSSKAGPEDALTGVFNVDAAGAIQMKLAGRVEIKGLTPAQASDKIATSLKSFVKDPVVQVAIISVPRTVVFLSGAVTRPGVVAVSDNVTLGEVLTMYGYDEKADLTRIRVIHRDDKGERTMKEYDFTRWLKPAPGDKPDEANNPVLSDRDMVIVASRVNPPVGVVSVEGDVNKPTQIPVRTGVPTRLREAISMAGGINPGTADYKINIRRYGVPGAINVDYLKMEAGDPQNDIELRPDDIIYVQKMTDDQYITLISGFTKPGKIPYRRSITLTQAIGEAGGVTLYSKDKEGTIFRHPNGTGDPTKAQTIRFNMKKMRENKEPDIALLPGDIVEMQLGGPPRPPIDTMTLISTLATLALLATGRR